MDAQAYIDEVKFRLTGSVLETELDDESYQKIIDMSLREIQRYIDSTELMTIPFEKCIDMTKFHKSNGRPLKINTVSAVFRAEGYVASDTGDATADPMQVAQWQLISGTGNLYNFQNYVYDYASWNTLLQMRNITSTDLAFYYDKLAEKLYINIASSAPSHITIEYIPRFDSVDEIISDYWIDMLSRLITANAKVIVGRIRSRYTASDAVWSQDGDTILAEGIDELSKIREYMEEHSQLCYPID